MHGAPLLYLCKQTPKAANTNPFLRLFARCSSDHLVLAGKRFSREKLLDLQQLLGGIDRRPLVSDLRFVIGFAAAHPAGTVDLPLGQPSSGTMFPSKDIFLSSKLAKNIFLSIDHSHALLTIVTAVSVQL